MKLRRNQPSLFTARSIDTGDGYFTGGGAPAYRILPAVCGEVRSLPLSDAYALFALYTCIVKVLVAQRSKRMCRYLPRVLHIRKMQYNLDCPIPSKTAYLRKQAAPDSLEAIRTLVGGGAIEGQEAHSQKPFWKPREAVRNIPLCPLQAHHVPPNLQGIRSGSML